MLRCVFQLFQQGFSGSSGDLVAFIQEVKFRLAIGSERRLPPHLPDGINSACVCGIVLNKI